jgi:hypothetical protein
MSSIQSVFDSRVNMTKEYYNVDENKEGNKSKDAGL